jgi:transposase
MGGRSTYASRSTLCCICEPPLAQQPASGNLFVFVGHDSAKVKCLYWDRTGFALWYKRLENGHFPSPAALNVWLEVIEIPAREVPDRAVAVTSVA